MRHEVFLHNDPDHYHSKELTLHDCYAEKITYQDGILRFSLLDGFWITPHHEGSDLDKVVRTDAAQVDFRIDDIDFVYAAMFTRHLFRKNTVEYWDASRLMDLVNSNRCTFEFIDQYRTHYEQMWRCALHSKKRPYYRELQLHLPDTEAVYHWNRLRPDWEW